MSMLLQREAPAKINLFLRVTGRLPNGYHALDSLFLPLELSDRIELELQPMTGSPSVSCRSPELPALDGPTNLAARAAMAFLTSAGHRVHAAITVHKGIWVAAGLGGGSSDAAAVLLLLQQALGGLSADELHRLAVGLGADVPFFLDPAPARARGIGDELARVAGIPALDLVLLNPGFPLGTREVYQAIDAASVPPTAEPVLAPPLPLERLVALVSNDLEPAALRLCPPIGQMKRLLREQGALAAGLSGSGPTVFGIFPDRASAARAAHTISQSHSFLAIPTRTLAA